MRRVAFWIGAFSLACAAVPAAAQAVFHCSSPSGTYVSARPCPSSAMPVQSGAQPAKSPARPVYFGPAPEPQQRYERPTPRVGEAPSHLQYMSPTCSSMNDALRTAQSKGLNYDTVQQMQIDYRKQCAEQDMEARSRASREDNEKRNEKRQADKEAQVSQAQEQNRSALRQQQCIESRRILMNKKARTDLTEGERADLVRFEENFKSRCG